MIEFIENQQQLIQSAPPMIIPVASGKGGVGKTMTSVNLAISLSQRGLSTLLVDLDFGCANAHTYMGIKSNGRGLGDYIVKKEYHLLDIVQATRWNNLSIIVGEQHVPDSGNLQQNVRERIISEIAELKYNVIVLDLGAGTSNNVIDFFLLSNCGIMVTAPTHGAILNAYSFLKTCIFRLFALKFTSAKGKRALAEIKKRDDIGKYPTFWDLLNEIAGWDQQAAEDFKSVLDKFKPNFIFNMVEEKNDTVYLKELLTLIYEKLIIEPEVLGYLPKSEKIHFSVKSRAPFMIGNNANKELFKQTTDKLLSSLYENEPLFDTSKYTTSFDSVQSEISQSEIFTPLPKKSVPPVRVAATSNSLKSRSSVSPQKLKNNVPVKNSINDYMQRSLNAMSGLGTAV